MKQANGDMKALRLQGQSAQGGLGSERPLRLHGRAPRVPLALLNIKGTQ